MEEDKVVACHNDSGVGPRASFTISRKWLSETQLQLCKYLFAASLIRQASAQQTLDDVPCNFDLGIGRPGGSFDSNGWFRRGRCIHNIDNYDQCRATLRDVISAQDSIVGTEYNASASTLALLPTLGALFGAPTPEIWLLSRLVPFAGSLSMLLSFGGSVIPSDISEYKSLLARKAIVMVEDQEATSSAIRHRGRAPEEEKLLSQELSTLISNIASEEEADPFIKNVIQKIRKRVNFPELNSEIGSSSPDVAGHPKSPQRRLPIRSIIVGCVVMFVLLGGVQASMAVVEIGSVYTTWCTSTWWMHVWYLVVTGASLLDSWIQLPLAEHYKLYLSPLPQHVTAVDYPRGSPDPEQQKQTTASTVKDFKSELFSHGMGQLVAEQASWSTPQSTLVIITTEHDDSDPGSTWRWIVQTLSKAVSLTIFVFATSIFAAVALLALPMAQMILIVCLGAGLGSRVIATSIVSLVYRHAPVVHILARSEEQANNVVAAIMRMKSASGKLQVEVQGHIFVDNCKVAKRSRLWRATFGVIARAPRLTAGRRPF